MCVALQWGGAKTKALLLCYSAALALAAFPVAAASGNKGHLKTAVEAAKLCDPFKFDAKKAVELFGVKIPDVLAVIGDTTVGWKAAAEVATFSSSSGIVTAAFKLMCTPSPEGAVIKALKLDPKNVAITDNFTCRGKVKDNKVDGDLSCEARGEIGKILAAVGILKERLKPVIETALAAK